MPSSQLIFSEVSYPYTPTVGYTITGTLTLVGPHVHEPAHHARRPTTAPPAPDALTSYRIYALIGSAVVDLIRSMAKREVTFFSGTVAISFL